MEFEDFLQQFNADNIFKQKVFKKFSSALQEDSLEPYQVELIKLQNYLDKQNKKMIVLVEGRDASGKGGAIRRITRKAIYK